LNDQAPLYHRPTAETAKQNQINPAKVEDRLGLTAGLWKLIECPDIASRAWVWDQYDSTVGGQTVKRPGAADAAVVKLEGLWRALALTTDCTPRYCAADPEEGGKQAVAEAWRNLTAVGARPLALTDNMNFGNPERPEIMGQFAAAIRGMAAACEALDFPVVSGNVSLYNETRDPSGAVRAILPTPAIGGLGVLDDAAQAVGIALGPWLDVVVVGVTKGWLGQSLWLREVAGREEGAPPPVDLQAERATGDFVRAQILAGHVRACHDVSDGGILVAVAEMAMAGLTGVRLFTGPRDIPSHAYWYGEDQGRYILAVPDAASFIRVAEAAGLPAVRIGTSGGQDLTLPDGGTISVRALRAAHERFFPSWMDG
jgi:phosphoribosylformylglycinamidine synthase